MKSNTEQSWTFVEWGVGLRKRKVEVDWRSLRAESHHINQYSKSQVKFEIRFMLFDHPPLYSIIVIK